MGAAFDSDVDVTVEIGFGSGPLAASPSWTDVSTFVKSATWTRGRTSVQSDFAAGAGTVWFDNSAGEFYPWNTSGSYTPNVKRGVPIRIIATYDAQNYPLFYGYVAAWPTPYPTGDEELAAAEIVESFAQLVGKDVTDSYDVETTDERVAALLDDAGWPAGLRDIGSGVTDVAALETEAENILDLLRACVEVEQGQLFQAGDGDLTFLNRVAASSASSDATFGPDGSELTYTDITVIYDDDLLINEALVTDATLIEVQVTDSTSVSENGPSTYEALNEQIGTPPVALNVAEWIVGKYKDVEPRIVGLTVDPAGDPSNLWPEVLGRELRDVITVEASYPGSGAQLVQDVAVETLTHSFTAGGVWTVTYGLHPLSDLEQEDFWILGTSELGTETNLA